MISALALSLLLSFPTAQNHDEYLAGYMIIPTAGRVDESFNAGFSMYVSAWPLLSVYPGHRFQSGLPGTWMFAQYDGAAPKNLYSDVEGGLGWWTDTRFPTETPKFIMGGVGPNFSEIANGPAHGAGSWEDPRGLYGVAQLSPWLLFPIDGLNLKQGTCGQVLGYGYLNLPLCDAKPTTDGQPMPTGGNCWTLFLNSANFKGPVAFFTPYFWSHTALKDPRLRGQLLDSRPVGPNTAIQMETQYIPCRMATDSKGESFLRIANTSFPRSADGRSVLLQQSTSYNATALHDEVQRWFAGGPPCSGAVDARGATVRKFGAKGYMTWEVRSRGPDGKETKVPLECEAFVIPSALDSHTFGCTWDDLFVEKQGTNGGSLVTFPEFFQLVHGDDPKRARWMPITPNLVPAETGLQNWKSTRPIEEAQAPYTTPNNPTSCWKSPGPAAGPFKAHLGDGTVVTYYWYRFADQPALLNAGLTKEEREVMQRRVVKLHRLWNKSRNYLAPPAVGKLAALDPALIVKPPKGLEAGYVPIATDQRLQRR